MEKSEYEQTEFIASLNRLLKEGEVKFTYKKMNGELREARGTRNINMIPETDCPTGKGNSCSYCTNYYDLDKKAWRRLLDCNLVSIDFDSIVKYH